MHTPSTRWTGGLGVAGPPAGPAGGAATPRLREHITPFGRSGAYGRRRRRYCNDFTPPREDEIDQHTTGTEAARQTDSTAADEAKHLGSMGGEEVQRRSPPRPSARSAASGTRPARRYMTERPAQRDRLRRHLADARPRPGGHGESVRRLGAGRRAGSRGGSARPRPQRAAGRTRARPDAGRRAQLRPTPSRPLPGRSPGGGHRGRSHRAGGAARLRAPSTHVRGGPSRPPPAAGRASQQPRARSTPRCHPSRRPTPGGLGGLPGPDPILAGEDVSQESVPAERPQEVGGARTGQCTQTPREHVVRRLREPRLSGRPERGDIVGDVAKDLSTLVRQEFDLAKTEAEQEASRAGRGAGCSPEPVWPVTWSCCSSRSP